ncbi:unnamed protein product [Mucor hiemalis]
MIHIMGMNCHISLLKLIDKNVYVVQDIFSFKYPKTLKQIKEGSVQENLLLDIDDIYNNFANDVTDKMDLIRNERINKKPKSLLNDYISAVMWNELDDDDIESESEEEE